MKRALRLLLWLLGFGCLWLPVFDDPPLHTGAYLQDVSGAGAVVCLVTAAAEPLQLTLTDADGAVVAEPATAAVRRHRFALTGLRPGQRYRYAIRDAGGAQRDAGSFVTAPADDRAPVHFCVVGDSGKVPWWVWLQRSPLFWPVAANDWLPPATMVTRIGTRIAEAGPDFLLHVGDIVYPKGMQAHYAAGFFRPFAAVLRQAPVYAALGNHDVIEDGGRQALANFCPPAADFTADGRCYSFAWGSVRVFVVDLNPPGGAVVDDGAAPAVDERAPEPLAIGYLRQELPRATEPWLVVVSHYPILSASRQGDRSDLEHLLLPLLQQYAVDLYLCGHDHNYQRFGDGGGDGDGDGLVMVTCGGGGKSLYSIREHPAARVAKSAYHFCSVAVQGPQLTLRAIDVDGVELDRLQLQKAMQGRRWQALQSAQPARAARIESLLR